MSSEISPERVEEIRQQFDQFDIDGNGHISTDELGEVFKSCGESIPGYKLRDMISEIDLDKNGVVNFNEFLKMMTDRQSARTGSQFRNFVTKRSDVKDYGASSEHANADIKHSVAKEEQSSFANWINRLLIDDPDLKDLLPLSEGGDDIYRKSKNGILLCKVVNKSVPDTIDERTINKGKLNVFLTTENLNLAINSARSIGCNVVNIGWKDIADEKPHLILGLLWQLIKIGLLSHVNLTAHAELAALLQDGETLEDLARLSPEELLLRWVNHHLEKAGCVRRIHNFSNDIKDSEVYAYLLNQIAPEHVRDLQTPQAVLHSADLMKRASAVILNAEKMDAASFVTPKDIVAGNAKLNMAFVANLFNNFPALETTAETIEMERIEETREEKTYRNWMNSLGVNPYVNNLYFDLTSGVVLFQIYDCIRSNYVAWEKVNKPPFKQMGGRMKKIENCNYAVELGRGLKFSLVGIGGEDIFSENHTLTLALVWQMMRAYTLSIIAKLSGDEGRLMKDAEIVEWANETLNAAGKASRINNFKDPSISNSRVVLELIDAIRPGVIRQELVEQGDSDEAKLANAKFAISCARKAGAQVYALPEDLVEVNPKMTLTIFACLMTLARQLQTKN